MHGRLDLPRKPYSQRANQRAPVGPPHMPEELRQERGQQMGTFLLLPLSMPPCSHRLQIQRRHGPTVQALTKMLQRTSKTRQVTQRQSQKCALATTGLTGSWR